MNRNTLFIFLLLPVFFGINSCQKQFLDPNATSNVTGDFRAKINGVQFVANKATSAAKYGGIIALAGKSTDGQMIILRVADSGVHVYTLDIGSSSNAGIYQKDSTALAYTTNQGNTAAQSGGTLSVTSIDPVRHTMSGVFSMKVYRQLDSSQKTITEGVFNNITYDTAFSSPPNLTDTFRVKIDGADFVPPSIFGFSGLNIITVSGSNQAGSKSVGLSFPSNITPGTYSLNGFTYLGLYNPNSTTALASDSGSLTILEHNTTTKRIRGNFDFHAQPLIGTTPQATLTAGYFSVKYQ